MGAEQTPATLTDNQRLSSGFRTPEISPPASESPADEVESKTQEEEHQLRRADLKSPRERMIFDFGNGSEAAIKKILTERKPIKKGSKTPSMSWYEVAGNVPENI